MHQRARLIVGAAALVAATVFATNTLVSAQQQDPAAKGGAELGIDPAQMAEMFKLGTPGKEHAELMKGVGKWENMIQMRMGPDMPWIDSKGTMEARSMLDGRYLVQESQMNLMGMAMKGVNIIGFDNSTSEYTSMWADSMSTWWVSSRGKLREDGVVELKGTMKDMAGERPFRMELKHVGPDQVDMVMYDTIPPQGEVEVMRMSSKRSAK
jgi:hypothetical protein